MLMGVAHTTSQAALMVTGGGECALYIINTTIYYIIYNCIYYTVSYTHYCIPLRHILHHYIPYHIRTTIFYTIYYIYTIHTIQR